jgi:hypothetical protein
MKLLPEMVDITANQYGIEEVEIVIRPDSTVLWINTPDHCIFRICQLKNVVIRDERKT